ncbi:hypothetical protein DM01DRAFT_1332085 [Hesseltinella vesiculosa]|uniref:Uncharacterized protein n=1 Tax=Hesseltinella vesiculosa TaxID=101127 RepID=A0A1X2GTX8_9FUNG|nr:hypothetical protein DM01DRAFT_1332085 [Hesseltinella vesiculosa]
MTATAYYHTSCGALKIIGNGAEVLFYNIGTLGTGFLASVSPARMDDDPFFSI